MLLTRQLPDKPVDNGEGITVTKTRYSINGDTNAITAQPGDTIVWNITVINNSNVEKTITLTEKLEGATLNKDVVTLAAGEKDDTVTATYIVKDTDSGELYNTVKASTGEPGDKENPEAKDDGTEIRDEDTYTVIYKDSDEYGGTIFATHLGLKAGASTPEGENSWFENKEKDFIGWTPVWQRTVSGTEHTIIYTAMYREKTKHTLTIHYKWHSFDGIGGRKDRPVAESYSAELAERETFSITSPKPDLPCEYSISDPVCSGTMSYLPLTKWVYYYPVVHVQHIYRINGNEVGTDIEKIGTTPETVLDWGRTISTSDIGKKTTYENEEYQFNSSDSDKSFTMSSDPNALTSQPVIKLYYDRTEKETHNVIVHYKWAGTDVTAAEDQVEPVEERKFYMVQSPAGIRTVPFANMITDGAQMTISGYMGTEDIEKTVYYSPQYTMKYVLQENGETKYAGNYQGEWNGAFGKSYTIDNYIGTSFNPGDAVWGQYLCTEVTPAVFPANPEDLKPIKPKSSQEIR